jgi:hypothetical protein
VWLRQPTRATSGTEFFLPADSLQSEPPPCVAETRQRVPRSVVTDGAQGLEIPVVVGPQHCYPVSQQRVLPSRAYSTSRVVNKSRKASANGDLSTESAFGALPRLNPALRPSLFASRMKVRLSLGTLSISDE